MNKITAAITAVNGYVPEYVLTNAELEKLVDTSDEWITSRTGINEWIKLAGVGGKVESGRILIFESRPAKWLFKDQSDVTLLVTNNVFPPTNVITRDWFNSHPCVIYLGDIKPSETKGQKIVEL